MAKNSKNIKNSTEKNLPPQILKELETLFSTLPPAYVKKSVTEILLSYLCEIEPEEYTPELREIIRDIYALLKFLEVAEMYFKKLNN